MTEAARIRPATPADWPGARELLREGDDLHAALAPDFFRSGERDEGEWREWLTDETAGVFVAKSPEAAGLSGVIVVRIYDTPRNPTMVPRRRGHVETVVVTAAARRRGLGRRLMEEAADWASRRGAVEVVLTTWAGNPDAEAFYRRLGYSPVSTVFGRSTR